MSTTPATHNTDKNAIPELAGLKSTPASSIKKLGWKAVVKAVKTRGPQVVTNHDTPEVVVLEAGQYADLVRQLRENDPLEMLRVQFDQRLASLKSADTGAGLRDAISAGPNELAEAANITRTR